ncbi:hypothetical protein OIU79_018695 [Salix purpurea]|uniref:Uncharacterized protein n=1 Tax=Salix purpurea TaxID=77065 RepID=A0A9Q1ALB9_SALPP|nr:hypothetical protein OIU79_018695 [Salix purpurea]
MIKLERNTRLMMRTTAVILVLGLTFLNLQVDAKRHVFKEITAEKTDKQPLSNVQQGDDGTDIKPNTQGKASTYSNTVTGSVPAVDTKNDNATSSPTSNNNGSPDDETNSSYGNYGNPSGSSTETHHSFTNDCQPKKGC